MAINEARTLGKFSVVECLVSRRDSLVDAVRRGEQPVGGDEHAAAPVPDESELRMEQL